MRAWSWVGLLGVASTGCIGGVFTERLPDAAAAVFGRAAICPASRVAVKPRPDIVPHTVYGSPPAPAQPPAEITNDPERVQLWQSQQPKPFDIDSIAKTYEVTGCGTTTLYVCAHPQLDGSQGAFSATAVEGPDGETQVTLYTDNHADVGTATTTTGAEVLSSVVCMPVIPAAGPSNPLPGRPW